jgi:MFS transporter, UMF1 family
MAVQTAAEVSATVPIPATRRAVAGWTLYDLANSVATMLVITSTFPLWFNASGGRDGALAAANSAATLLALICAVPVGMMIDRTNRRVMPLALMTVIGVAGMATLGTIGLPAVLLLYIVTLWSIHTGQVVYESMLPDVSDQRNRARISGIGIALGFLGSFGGLAIEFAVSAAGLPVANVFRYGALAFALLGLPCLLWVRERPRVLPSERIVTDGRIATLFAPVRGNRPLLSLLIARFIYSVSSTTIILFGAIYTSTAVGLSRGDTRLTIMLVTLVGALSAFCWGFVTERIGYREGLMIALASWVAGLSLMAAVPLFALPIPLYWLAMVFVGLAHGSALTSERPLLVVLSRRHEVGQTFGLFAMTTRLAAIGGPLLWALIADWAGLGRPVAILVLVMLVIVALAIVRTVKVPATVAV